MKYKTIKKAIFCNRPNRFIAHVILEGQEEVVHVKNTGRCKELLTEGASVFLEEGENPKRKTKYSLVAVWKGKLLINMDSQAPNKLAEEALSAGKITKIGIPTFLKREVKFGNSRFDFYYEQGTIKGFVEVKGVTLEENGTALFPDAPTERGTKHIYEMIEAVKQGYQGAILFLIQMQGVSKLLPNAKQDSAFAKALQQAKQEGVLLLAYDCVVTEQGMELGKPVSLEIFGAGN